MTSHELAKKLLELPDLPVAVNWGCESEPCDMEGDVEVKTGQELNLGQEQYIYIS